MNILDVITYQNTHVVPRSTATLDITRGYKIEHRTRSIDELRERLLALRKDEFAPDDRIIIIHQEYQDYFYHGSPVSFFAHNLFTLIRELDMPLYIFMIVTPWHDFNRAVEPFIIHPEDAPTVVNTLFTPMFTEIVDDWMLKYKDMEKDIRFNAMAVMGKPKSSRIKLFQFLKTIDNGSIKYSLKAPDSESLMLDPHPGISKIHGTVTSFPDCPDENWPRLATNEEFISLDQVKPHDKVEPEFDFPTDNTIDRGDDPKLYQKFAVDIITETVYQSPLIYLTEKTMRALLFKTPFVMLGPKGTLELLRSKGCETFGDYWNEEYDQIEDPVERFMACCEVIKMINDMPLDDMKQMYDDMLPLLERNRETLLNYVDNEMRPLYNKIYV